MKIDITFDFRTDSFGRDPDKYSPTLWKYHKALWSKSLPNGKMFTLNDTIGGSYLHHSSELGEFFLSSDSAIPSFTRYKRLGSMLNEMPQEDHEEFHKLGYTIGGMIIFPSDKRHEKMTINGARGFNRKIADRFDLTLECIRRYYTRENSPLSELLERYGDFFDLFNDFSGYVKFFLLEDLVSNDFSSIKFSSLFDDFKTSPVPSSREQYLAYRENCFQFLESRNKRISDFYNIQSSN